MTSIENKELKNLLELSTVEQEGTGRYIIFNEAVESFYFRYDVNKDIITEGGYELSEGQKELVKNKAYEFHIEQEPENSDDTFGCPNYYKEYGINEASFL